MVRDLDDNCPLSSESTSLACAAENPSPICRKEGFWSKACEILALVGAGSRQKREIKTHGFAWNLGRCTAWLRDKHLLLGVQMVSAVVIAVVVFFTEPDGRQLSWARCAVLVSAVLAALASAADRFADHHAGKVELLAEAAERAAGVRVVVRLLALLENVKEVVHSSPAAARQKIPLVRLAAADLSSGIPGAEEVRASVYTLTRDACGKYQMIDPATRGRPEDAVTAFRAADEPGHSIWKRLAAPDKNCEIFNEGDPVPDFEWQAKTYKTFVTLPIRTGNAVFGMLTANALKPGDLSELDRVAFIAAARILALAEAAADPSFKTRDDTAELKSLGASTISDTSAG